MARFRYRTPALTGRWRETRAAAAEDAVRAGQALREAGDDGELRWLVPGEIEAQNETPRAAVGSR